MKKVFTVIFGLCMTLIMHGQTYDYGDDVVPNDGNKVPTTVNCSPTSVTYTDHYALKESYIPDANTPVKVIKINLHIFQDDNGLNNWQNTQNHLDTLRLFFQRANNLYTNNINPSDPVPGVTEVDHSGVSFELENIYFYQNSSLNTTTSRSACLTYIKANYPDRAKNFPYFFTEGTYGASGYTSMPSTNFNQELSVISFKTYSHYGQYTIWALPKHIAHELGHDVDLRHTYTGGGATAICNNTNIDYLSDIFNNGPCPHDAGWSCNVNASDNTCTNNLMGGSSGSGYYSPQQAGKMQRALHLKSIAKYVDGSVFSSTPQEIIADETWDFQMRVYSDIVVKSGATLTLTCKLMMPPNGKIIVEPGGRLNVYGGIITSAVDEPWGGIEAVGNPNALQQSANHGYVYIKNDALIENAKIAVYSNEGGIIKAKDSRFINNGIGVKITNYNQSSSMCYLLRNTFQVNDDNLFATSGQYNYYGQIMLSGIVRLYSLSGNTIEYTGNNNLQVNGIYSGNSGFKLKNSYYSSTYHYPQFRNLYKAIWMTMSNSSEIVEVHDAIFENNVRTIHGNVVNNLSIKNCDVDMGNTNDPNSYGIYLYHCEAPKITLNTFRNGARGIQIHTLGDEGEFTIYKNTFENFTYDPTGYEASAFIASGAVTTYNENQGMQLKCNTFNNNHKSITVKTGAIKKVQGSWDPASPDMNGPANNRFAHYCHSTPANPSQDDAFYVESGSTVVYQYYHLENSEPDYKVNFGLCRTVNKINMLAPLVSYTDFENICPDVPTGPIAIIDNPISKRRDPNSNGINDKMSLIRQLDQWETKSVDAYKALVDNGNTDDVLNAIHSTNSWKYTELTSQIGELNGFISDEALTQFVSTDMNRHVAKAIALAQNSPLPSHMQSLIETSGLPEDLKAYVWSKQTGLSSREAKAMQIEAYQDQKEELMRELVREFISDSEYTNSQVIISFLQDRDDVDAQKQLLKVYKHLGQKEDALALIDDLKQQQLDNNELSTEEINDYWAMQKLAVELQGMSIAEQEQFLKNKEEALVNIYEKQRMASGMAYAFLHHMDAKVEEPVDLSTSFPIAGNEKKSSSPAQKANYSALSHFVELYPNPVQNQLTVEYIVDPSAKHSIMIFDIQGKLVLEHAVQQDMGIEQIDVSELKSGTYVLQIANKKSKFVVK